MKAEKIYGLEKFIFLIVVLLALIVPLAFSDAVFHADTRINGSVVCLDVHGGVDTGCDGAGSKVLLPNGTLEDLTITEFGDDALPGVWIFTYQVSSNPILGSYMFYINMSNSNSSHIATSIDFFVEEKSNVDISTELGDHDSGMVGNISQAATNESDHFLTLNETIPERVWTYVTRGLNVFEFDVNINQTARDNIIQDVNNTLNDAHGIGLWNLTSNLIWDFTTRTLTAFGFTVGLNETGLVDINTTLNDAHGEGNWNLSSSEVWNYIGSSTTDPENRTVNVSGLSTHSADDVWTSTTRNLTEFGFSVNLTNEALTDINTTLNDAHGIGLWNLTANLVWDFVTRVLTAFEFDVNLNQTALSNINDTITGNHGEGLYNDTGGLTIQELNDTINEEHGEGLYNLSAGETTGLDAEQNQTIHSSLGNSSEARDISEEIENFMGF